MESKKELFEVKLELNGEVLNLFAKSHEEEQSMLEASEMINQLSSRYRENDKKNILSDRQIMSLVALHLTRELLLCKKSNFIKI